MKKLFPSFIISLAGAFIIEGYLTITTSLLPSADKTYGAPFPVGISKGIQLNIFMSSAFHTQLPTLDLAMLVVNILLTTLLFLLIARFLGLSECVVAIIGIIVSSIVWFGIAAQMRVGTELFDGVPFRVTSKNTYAINGLALWANSMIIATVFALLWRGLRKLFRH